VKVHFTKAKGNDNYKVKMMLEGAKLKNKEKKPKYNFRMETRKTKQEHDTKSKKWNDNGRKDEGRRKLM